VAADLTLGYAGTAQYLRIVRRDSAFVAALSMLPDGRDDDASSRLAPKLGGQARLPPGLRRWCGPNALLVP
jgi:hypothetical protein